MNNYKNYKPSNDGIKTSNKAQWTERAGAPIATKYMEKAEIEMFREVLARSYKCPIEYIVYDFEKIRDESDEDRDDCLMLTYRMKLAAMRRDGTSTRIIFRAKVPIPEQIKNMAESMMYKHFQKKTIEYTQPQQPQQTQQPQQFEPPSGHRTRTVVRKKLPNLNHATNVSN
jgi:hypothetical protein